MGIQTTNLPQRATAAEVLANWRESGLESTVRLRMADLATLLAASGPLADVIAGVTGGFLVYPSLASLTTDLAHGINSGAWVIGDATSANDGVYRKLGASGAGSWTRVGDLPYRILTGVDGGTGTANALAVDTSGSAGDGRLVLFTAYRANTGSPVTVAFDGATGLTMKTSAGADCLPGVITTGMPILGIVAGSTFRLLSDPSTSATLAQKAGNGRNTDITEIAGLTTPLAVAQGGTGANTQAGARTALGLGSAATQPSSAFVAAAAVGAASGVAPLGVDGKVAAAYLPSYVDDVLEAASYAALPGTGEAGKVYVTLDTNKAWRWSGSTYVEISASPGSTDAVVEGATNLYHTGARVLSVLLAGLSTATNAVIVAGDTVLTALGKLQAQISGLTAALAGKVSQGGDLGTGATVPTPSAADDSQKVANTAWIRAYMSAVSSGVVSVNGRSGTVTLQEGDVTGALGYTPFSVAGGSTTGPLTLGFNYPYIRWGDNPAAWRMAKYSDEGTLGRLRLQGSTDNFSGVTDVMSWDGTNVAVGIGSVDPYTEAGVGASLAIRKTVAGGFVGDLIYNLSSAVNSVAGRQYLTGGVNSYVRQRLYAGNTFYEDAGDGVTNGFIRRAAKHTAEGPDGTDLSYFDTGAAVISVPLQGAGLSSIGRQFVVTDRRFAGGAVIGGTVDCSPAVQAAVNAAVAAGGGIVYAPRGRYKLSTAITITGTHNVYIIGEGDFAGGTVFESALASANLFVFSGCQHCGIWNAYIRGTVIPTAGFAVEFTNDCFRCDVDRMRIDYVWSGICVSGATETRVSRTQFRYLLGSYAFFFGGTASGGSFRAVLDDVVCDNPYPLAYGAVRTWAATTEFGVGDIIYKSGRVWQCSQAGTSGASGPSTIPGSEPVSAFSTDVVDGTARWRFVCGDLHWITQDSYAYSLVLAKVALINGVRGLLMTDSANTGNSYPLWVIGWDIEIDHSFYANAAFWHGEGVQIAGSWFSSCLAGVAIEIVAAFRGEVDIGTSRIAYAHFHGCTIEVGPLDVSIHDCKIGDNSQAGAGLYHGIAVASGTNRFKISNNRIGDIVGAAGNPQGYAVIVNSGASDYYSISGNTVQGNATGGVADGGTGTHKYVTGNI